VEEVLHGRVRYLREVEEPPGRIGSTTEVTTYTCDAEGRLTQVEMLPGGVSGTSRVPDFWNRSTNTGIEAKNVSPLGFTSQIRDMAAWAASQGHTFKLWVRDSVTLSPELQTAINNGFVTLRTFQWP
jgi:hypothetical protein